MTRRLILDIGMHLGEDTEYYLARGFRVVAIEANPELVAVCKEKFRSDIQQGNLEILHGAIVEDRNQKEVRFFKNCWVQHRLRSPCPLWILFPYYNDMVSLTSLKSILKAWILCV